MNYNILKPEEIESMTIDQLRVMQNKALKSKTPELYNALQALIDKKNEK